MTLPLGWEWVGWVARATVVNPHCMLSHCLLSLSSFLDKSTSFADALAPLVAMFTVCHGMAIGSSACLLYVMVWPLAPQHVYCMSWHGHWLLCMIRGLCCVCRFEELRSHITSIKNSTKIRDVSRVSEGTCLYTR